MEALRALGLSRTVVVSSLRRSWDPTRPEREEALLPKPTPSVCLECNFSGSLQSSSDLAATPEAPSVLFENPLQSWVEPPGRFSVPLSWGSLMSLQDLEFLKLASSVNSLCQPCFPLNLLIPSN